MNLLAYLIGFNWGLRRALRSTPPPYPPGYINPNWSTGVPPPPKPEDEKAHQCFTLASRAATATHCGGCGRPFDEDREDQ